MIAVDSSELLLQKIGLRPTETTVFAARRQENAEKTKSGTSTQNHASAFSNPVMNALPIIILIIMTAPANACQSLQPPAVHIPTGAKPTVLACATPWTNPQIIMRRFTLGTALTAHGIAWRATILLVLTRMPMESCTTTVLSGALAQFCHMSALTMLITGTQKLELATALLKNAAPTSFGTATWNTDADAVACHRPARTITFSTMKVASATASSQQLTHARLALTGPWTLATVCACHQLKAALMVNSGILACANAPVLHLVSHAFTVGPGTTILARADAAQTTGAHTDGTSTQTIAAASRNLKLVLLVSSGTPTRMDLVNVLRTQRPALMDITGTSTSLNASATGKNAKLASSSTNSPALACSTNSRAMQTNTGTSSMENADTLSRAAHNSTISMLQSVNASADLKFAAATKFSTLLNASAAASLRPAQKTSTGAKMNALACVLNLPVKLLVFQEHGGTTILAAASAQSPMLDAVRTTTGTTNAANASALQPQPADQRVNTGIPETADGNASNNSARADGTGSSMRTEKTVNAVASLTSALRVSTGTCPLAAVTVSNSHALTTTSGMTVTAHASALTTITASPASTGILATAHAYAQSPLLDAKLVSTGMNTHAAVHAASQALTSSLLTKVTGSILMTASGT